MYARCGRLPPLVALRRTWPQGAPTGVHPYHVAGSFLDFAIQRFGIERVRRYYTHCLECQGVLGTSFAALETEWRKWLAEREVPAEQELFVLRVTGLGEDRVMPESLRARKRVPLFDGKTLDAWRADADGVWSAKDSPQFSARLERCGFDVDVRTVRARGMKGPVHVLWFARKR